MTRCEIPTGARELAIGNMEMQYIKDSTHEIINGDALDVLRNMDDKSCDVCITSPPYYGLRDYGKEGQIGLEGSPEKYINRLVEIFREIRRILKDDGTLWINIGDSYATGTKAQRQQSTNPGVGANRPEAQNSVARIGTPEGCKTKDLIGIPWMLAFALRADGWYLRQDIIWHKTNCMPESVRDRCTKSHEYIFLLSKLPRYYFDADAISEPIAGSSAKRYIQDIKAQNRPDGAPGKPTLHRNKRSVWQIATARFKGAHFAVFPENLVEPCVLAGSRAGGTVLDPFCGSGTTGVVAVRTGRKFVGIELNDEYCKIATERILNEERRSMPSE